MEAYPSCQRVILDIFCLVQFVPISKQGPRNRGLSIAILHFDHRFSTSARFEDLQTVSRLIGIKTESRQNKKGGLMRKLLLAFIMWFAISGAALAAVNINTATKDELVTLKGVGEKRAQAIIDYRTKNGPFKTVDDLEKVPGIGPGLMKQIKSQISVSGPTTVDKPAAAAKTKTDDKKSTTTTSAKTDSSKTTNAPAGGKSDTKSTNK